MEALRDKVLKNLSDHDLSKFLADMPEGDQTWIFYALIADAANKREGLAINHLRDLLQGGTVEGFVQKHLERELDKLKVDVGASLKKIDGSIIDLKVVEAEKSIENLAIEVARKVRIDVTKGIADLADDMDQKLARMMKLQKDAGQETEQIIAKIGALQKETGHDTERLSKKISEAVGEKVGQKVGNTNLLFYGISLICAIAFGALAGSALSTGYSQADIQRLVQMTAAETAEQMQGAPAQGTRRQ